MTTFSGKSQTVKKKHCQPFQENSKYLSTKIRKRQYELHFQFGGTYYDYDERCFKSIDVFPGCDKSKTITSKLPLENGKVYCFRVTI